MLRVCDAQFHSRPPNSRRRRVYTKKQDKVILLSSSYFSRNFFFLLLRRLLYKKNMFQFRFKLKTHSFGIPGHHVDGKNFMFNLGTKYTNTQLDIKVLHIFTRINRNGARTLFVCKMIENCCPSFIYILDGAKE